MSSTLSPGLGNRTQWKMLLSWFWDDASRWGARMNACSASLQRPDLPRCRSALCRCWPPSGKLLEVTRAMVVLPARHQDRSVALRIDIEIIQTCPLFLSHLQYRSKDLLCCRMTPRPTLLHWYNLEKSGRHSQQLIRAEATGSLCFLSISGSVATALGELPAGTRCTIKYFPAKSCHYCIVCTGQ